MNQKKVQILFWAPARAKTMVAALIAALAASAVPSPSAPPAHFWCEAGIGTMTPGGACCAASCGMCGGAECNTQPGGEALCCESPIAAAG